LYREDSAAYNQAIMDFGATLCTPAKPQCLSCPLQQGCYAHRNEVMNDFPVRTKKITVKNRYFGYVFLEYNDEIWLHKRGAGDIWENLFEPYLVEHTGPISSELINNALTKHDYKGENIECIGSEKQRLTHQLIHFYFFRVCVTEKLMIEHGNWLSRSELEKLAFPKTVVSFFRKFLYF
jgi:A/G-specific adenine glycosylase